MKKFIHLILVPLIGFLIILFVIPKNTKLETLNGTILDITDTSIRLEINDEYKTEAIISKQIKNIPNDLKIGDNIIIYYDGMIQETYPVGIPGIEKIEKTN